MFSLNMEFALIAFLLSGALAGGFVNGLSGFGTSMVALSFWLHVAPPMVAVPIAVICSLTGHLQTFPSIWRSVKFRVAMPFLIGGLAGVPIGVYLLSNISVDLFKRYLGVAIILYCLFMLRRSLEPVVRCNLVSADLSVGFIGGILGGLSGLSGLVPSIWSSMKDWDKATKRGIFQTFNFVIAFFTLASQAFAGLITEEVMTLMLIALPGTICGVWLGHRVYKNLPDRRFNQVIYGILICAGLTLIANSM